MFLLWACFAVTTFISQAGFAYDGKIAETIKANEVIHDYSETNFDCDGTLSLFAGENEIHAVEGQSFFVDLIKFLAAKGPVTAFEVGTADDLLARSVRGDKLDIHHVGQAHPLEQIVPGYDRATAPAIAVPRAQHSTIPTVRGPYTGTARDQLAKDIRDLRNYTDAPNSSLRELIDLNKQTFPNAFQK